MNGRTHKLGERGYPRENSHQRPEAEGWGLNLMDAAWMGEGQTSETIRRKRQWDW